MGQMLQEKSKEDGKRKEDIPKPKNLRKQLKEEQKEEWTEEQREREREKQEDKNEPKESKKKPNAALKEKRQK